VVVLAPMFWSRTETSKTPPQAARGPAWPLIARLASEKPSCENAKSVRCSRPAGAVNSARRRTRRTGRTRRDFLGSTEHLPVLEGTGSSARLGGPKVTPDLELG